MTDWNRDPRAASSLGPKAVGADVPGGPLTSDAGALVLRARGQRLGGFEALGRALPDRRLTDDRAEDWQRILRCRDRTNGGHTGCYPDLTPSLVSTGLNALRLQTTPL
jgi:hypothetical protein